MAEELPKYNELYRPLLDIMADGGMYTAAELRKRVADVCGVTAEQMQRVSEKSKTNIFSGRVNWACVYLLKAGLLARPKRAVYVITEEGKRVHALPGVELTNAYLAEHYPPFAQFYGHMGGVGHVPVADGEPERARRQSTQEETPIDAIESAYKKLNAALADEILDTILRKKDPAFFERLVTQLLEAMGYGGAVCSNGKSGDEGIDGVIKEDKLGFDKIYIQAKCWDKEKNVSRPDVQAFVGALAGQGADKGAFITTAGFTQQARDFVAKQHHSKVVLIDGELLANLMIEHNLGVSTQSTYVIKHLDSDFFNEEA